MSETELLAGKRILAVDDEKDVLDIIREELELCRVTTAEDFDAAQRLLATESYDLVILDIMGVKGFDLLDITRQKQIPAVMLTAHALTPASLQRSIDQGAVSFLPKEELSRLRELITEIFEHLKMGRTHWERVIERLGPRFKEIWGVLWEDVKFPPDTRITW